MEALNEIADTTLIAVDCVRPLEAAKSIYKSIEHLSFSSVKLLSDSILELNGIESITIPKIATWQAYSLFCIKDLYRYVDTKWMLIIQADGFVINPHLWEESFKDFDYIGHVRYSDPKYQCVGNGGFSYRTRALMEWTSKNRAKLNFYHPEDVAISKQYRKHVIDAGFKIADIETANKFALPKQSPHSFGFHDRKFKHAN